MMVIYIYPQKFESGINQTNKKTSEIHAPIEFHRKEHGASQ
jgi:hypothetical protein